MNHGTHHLPPEITAVSDDAGKKNSGETINKMYMEKSTAYKKFYKFIIEFYSKLWYSGRKKR